MFLNILCEGQPNVRNRTLHTWFRKSEDTYYKKIKVEEIYIFKGVCWIKQLVYIYHGLYHKC